MSEAKYFPYADEMKAGGLLVAANIKPLLLHEN